MSSIHERSRVASRIGVWAAAVAIGALIAPGAAAAAKKSTTTTTVPPRPAASFASGTVAGLDGSTMEIQSTSSQTTVTVTSSTRYVQIENEATSDIAVGDCVSATGTGSTTKGIKATSVSVSQASSTGCTFGGAFAGLFPGSQTGAPAGPGGFGGGGAGAFRSRFGGANGTRPTFPAGGAARLRNFATASGSVTVIHGDTLTVKARIPKVSSKTKTSSKKTTKKSDVRPQFVTKSVKVTDGSAKVTTTTTATAAQLANGVCVSAVGPASSTGAITATSITISQPVDGSCTSTLGGGFAGFGGFTRAGGAA